MALLITEEDVKRLPMSVAAAIPVMEDAFREAGLGASENPPRTRMGFRNGFMQFGPAAFHSRRIAGFKLWANFGGGKGVRKSNVGFGHTYLYDMQSGELLAIVQAGIIGRYRTSAVTGVAAKYLSPESASTIGIIGCGGIAEGQIEAVCAVRPIRSIKAYSRTADNRAAFCARMSQRLKVRVEPATSAELAVNEAEIVITATTSDTPVLSGDWLARPGLVLAAGANHWYKREIDGKVFSRARLVVTDDREQSRLESGNLMWAVSHGLINWRRIEELGAVVCGRLHPPDFRDATILFGSHGLATTQVAIAEQAYALAKTHGVGREVHI